MSGTVTSSLVWPGMKVERAAGARVVGAGDGGAVDRRIADGDRLAARHDSKTVKIALGLVPLTAETLFTETAGCAIVLLITPLPVAQPGWRSAGC